MKGVVDGASLLGLPWPIDASSTQPPLSMPKVV